MESLDRTGAMTPIAAFLYVAKGILSPDECRKIINEYKDDPEFQWSTVQGAMGSELRTEHDVRKVREIHITDPRVWMWSERRVEIGKSLQSAVRLAVDSYRNNLESNNLSSFFPTITSDEGFKLLHYAEGYHFKEHFDQIPGGSRAFTCSVNLNSDYTGGEFEFFDGACRAELGVGDAVIFPSNFLFPHAVRPVTSGNRYSVITWLH